VSAALTKEAERLVRARFPGMTVRTKPDPGAAPPAALVFAPEIASVAPPSAEHLAYFGRGLDAEQVKAAAASKGVLVLSWSLEADTKLERLRKAQELGLELAKKYGGFVWDETTRELYTADEWRKRRVEGWEGELPNVERHVVIHYYGTDQGKHRAITLGMVKLGLPDLVVEDVPIAHSDGVSTLITAAAQLLVEGAAVGPGGRLAVDINAIRHTGARTGYVKAAVSGAALRGNVTFAIAKSEEGDPDNRLVEVRFDGYPGATEPERQGAGLTAILGARPQKVSGVKKEDAEIAAATKRAQARLPAVADAIRKGLPFGDRVSVKAPFDTDDGSLEWMWIAVSAWEGDVVRGYLENEPYDVKSLRMGAKVEVKQDSIADYVWRKADGTSEGGESSEILHRRALLNK